MLICLAGLRSIPDYIYEAAEVDRASKNGGSFWSITLPMALLPFIMLAVLFPWHRETLRCFDMVNLLTGGGAGLHHGRSPRSRLSALPSRGWANGLFVRLRDHPVRNGVRPSPTSM